jgi:hypothetical protein
MQVSPDTMRILLEMQAPPEQKLALLKALEADWLAYQAPASSNGINEETERLRNENTKAERKRAADRERMAAKREADRIARQSRAENATVPSESRDVAATVACDTRDQACDPGDRGPSRTSAQVVTLTSSLRSEAYPPVEPIGSTAPKGQNSRGSRIPADFCPDLTAAEKAGLTLAQAAVEADKFLDYWRAVPGAKGRKTDWPATWRNWCRSALDRLPQARKAPHERPHSDPKFDARQANLARALAGADSATGRRWQP